MTILVVGGSGFIGQSLLKHLTETSLDRICNISRNKSNIETVEDFEVDLSDLPTLKFVIGRIQPTIVYHLAAQASQKPNPNKPDEIIKSNILNTFNLIHSLPSHTHIIFASSIVIYGGIHDPTEFSPINTTSLYGASKVACEELIKSNYHVKGNPYNIFRLGAMVGPGMTHGLLKDVISKIKSDSKTLELWGKDPGSSKVYTHVQDVVEAITCERFIPNEIVNICNDDDISAREVAQITMKELGIKKEIVWDETKIWRGDNVKLNANNELMRDILQKDFLGSREAIIRAVEENK